MVDKKQEDDLDDDEYQFDTDEIFQFEDDDDEFRFSEDDELKDETSESRSLSSNSLSDFLEKIKQDGIQKHISTLVIGLLVIVILLYSMYKLYTVFFGSTDAPKVTAKPVVATKPVQIIEQPPAPETLPEVTEQSSDVLPIPESSFPVTSMTPSNNVAMAPEQLMEVQTKVLDLSKRLDDMEKSNTLLLQSMNMLQSQSTTTTARIENLDKGISNIQSQVMNLNNTLSKILEAAQKSPSAMTSTATSPSTTIFPDQQRTPSPISRIQHNPPPMMEREPSRERIYQGEPIRKEMVEAAPPAFQHFYVQAIIPGRAWLKDGSGKIFTVTIGDFVPGYGKILEINPEDGFVLTESGNKVEYGIDQY